MLVKTGNPISQRIYGNINIFWSQISGRNQLRITSSLNLELVSIVYKNLFCNNYVKQNTKWYLITQSIISYETISDNGQIVTTTERSGASLDSSLRTPKWDSCLDQSDRRKAPNSSTLDQSGIENGSSSDREPIRTVGLVSVIKVMVRQHNFTLLTIFSPKCTYSLNGGINRRQ